MPRLNKSNFQKTNKFSHLIAVEGKLERFDEKPEIDIKKIKNRYVQIKQNKDGSFTHLLRPSTYTFFIKVQDKGYLNKFDGYGYFKSSLISKKNNKVKLIYDKNLLN